RLRPMLIRSEPGAVHGFDDGPSTLQGLAAEHALLFLPVFRPPIERPVQWADRERRDRLLLNVPEDDRPLTAPARFDARCAIRGRATLLAEPDPGRHSALSILAKNGSQRVLHGGWSHTSFAHFMQYAPEIRWPSGFFLIIRARWQWGHWAVSHSKTCPP